jgi:signal peptidase II
MVEASRSKGWSKQAALLALFGALLLGIDALSKWFIHTYMPLMVQSTPVYPYGGISIAPSFLGIEISLVHATNKGAVSGILADYQMPLLLLRCALILGLIVYMVVKRPPRPMRIPLMMVLAGAIGNVIDVVLYGHVVDMVFFRFWGWPYPIFNFADSLICIGVVWLIILSMKPTRREPAA